MTDQIPHDLDAEQAVLGALLSRYVSAGTLLALITAEDFYRPAHAEIFTAICDLHRDGIRAEPPMVRDQLARSGSTVPDHLIIECQVAGSVQSVRAAEIVVRLSVARKVLIAAEQIRFDALENLDPADLLDRARATLARIDSPTSAAAVPDDVSTIGAFLDAVNEAPAPWVVPGLLRAGWRALLVAPEGLGKSVTARLIAIAAAQGIHPFTHRPIPPVRTLIIDLENPDDAIASTCKPINEHAKSVSAGYDDDRAWLWRAPAGINIRTRADHQKLEAVIAAVRPDLVCIGPMYKLYRVTARESDEIAAGEVQHVLDDMRTRFGFALFMEHHAPKSSGMAPRDLVPYGSSLWLRWPELGITLAPAGDNAPSGSVTVGRFRRDRMANAWPARLDRGGPVGFPWSGYWPEGMGE